jgi:hypothetical protein
MLHPAKCPRSRFLANFVLADPDPQLLVGFPEVFLYTDSVVISYSDAQLAKQRLVNAFDCKGARDSPASSARAAIFLPVV